MKERRDVKTRASFYVWYAMLKVPGHMRYELIDLLWHYLFAAIYEFKLVLHIIAFNALQMTF